jgi:hypothetical protein
MARRENMVVLEPLALLVLLVQTANTDHPAIQDLLANQGLLVPRVLLVNEALMEVMEVLVLQVLKALRDPRDNLGVQATTDSLV